MKANTNETIVRDAAQNKNIVGRPKGLQVKTNVKAGRGGRGGGNG